MNQQFTEQLSVILVYDKPDSNGLITLFFTKAGFNVHSFLYGTDFIDSWNKNENGIWNSAAIIVHKDLGDFVRIREYLRAIDKYYDAIDKGDFELSEEAKGIVREFETKDSMTSGEVIELLRQTDLGQQLRLILGSGEYAYPGVRDESVNKLQADAGYDPSIDVLPEWLVKFIKLGKVSEDEVQRFRGKEIVENTLGVQNRFEFLRRPFGKEKE